MATKKKKELPLQLDLDPDFVAFLKKAMAVADIFEGAYKIAKRDQTGFVQAAKKWKKHYRVFKK
jgi:hypothetical protein